jgi:hypothetical protein
MATTKGERMLWRKTQLLIGDVHFSEAQGSVITCTTARSYASEGYFRALNARLTIRPE